MKNLKLCFVLGLSVLLMLLSGCGPDIAAGTPPAAEVNEDSSGCGIYDALSRIGDDAGESDDPGDID